MKAGRTLLALLFFVGLFGVLVDGAPIYSRFLYSSLLLVSGTWLWTRWMVRGLSLERTARELRANVGDVFEENFRLTNRTHLPIPWIEIANRSTLPSAAGSRLFTLVMGGQFRIYTARTWLTQRGRFQLGPTVLTVGDPFGLFTASRSYTSQANLIVFPMIHEIPSFSTPLGLLTGGRAIREKSYDITPHAAGVREYVHGDAMKRIHWATSARRSRLMVKEFEQDPQAEVWIYLDSQKSVHHQKRQAQKNIPFHDMLLQRRPKFELLPSTIEYSVSIAASLAHYFIRQRRAVGLVSAGQTFNILPADRSERQEAKILETLAFVNADGNLPIAGLVASQSAMLPQGSSVILITPSTRSDLLLAVDDLLLRRLSPIIVLLDAQTFEGPSGTNELIAALRERRVPVIPVKLGDALPQTLSQISTSSFQETRSWQTRVSSPLI